MAKLYITANYSASTWYEMGWNIDLPDGYTADDVDSVVINWAHKIWIVMKDDTEHLIKKEGEVLDQVEGGCDGWKWSDNEQWSATGEHINV